MHQRTIETIKTLVLPILAEQGLELVDLQLGEEQGGLTLRVTIYKPDGVGIDDCSRVSRELGHLLEVEDLIKQAFRLEVSSPGLTTPLVTAGDFARNCGKKVKIKFAAADGPQTIVGCIGKTDADRVEIIDEGKEQEILLSEIHKAKLVIEF